MLMVVRWEDRTPTDMVALAWTIGVPTISQYSVKFTEYGISGVTLISLTAALATLAHHSLS